MKGNYIDYEAGEFGFRFRHIAAAGTQASGLPFVLFDSARREACVPYLFQTIIGRFLRNHHIVHVRFAQAGGGHSQEASLLLKLFDVVTTGVTHT